MKACIVTGGASGIGLATTRVLLDEGWKVAVCDRDESALCEAARALASANVSWHRVDITNEASVQAMVAQIVTRDGGIAGLVNSAGIGIARRFFDTSADDMRRMFEISVVGSFIVAKAAAIAMRDAGQRGAIVNLTSTAGQRGNLERSAYGSAKGAVIVLTQVMAVELASIGIRVNAVSPGPVATPLVDAMHTPEMRTRWTALTPQHRYAQPHEIATAIAFLLDDVKAGFITGHVLNVDGGLLGAGLME
ncbi:MAG: SDR family NAD(P)-dependent oxidoreductase [Burkholderiaceae bacterium]